MTAQPRTLRVDVGTLDDFNEGEIVTVGDGRAVVVRVGDELVSYLNWCPHAGLPLTGAIVRDERILCPHHFLRFRVSSGKSGGSGPSLVPVPVEINESQVSVTLPVIPEARPIRDVLLEHAKTWSRDEQSPQRKPL